MERMEAKPIVTCHGNQSLFSTLHPALASGLPKEVCEWRRSFGRAPRSVQLEGSFVPYDADILPEEDTKTLVSRPYFHIFWTDCDLDSYKQSVRDELAEWQAALKARNIPDWLIVVVIPDESKVKAKILPRSSVIDKVRSDFCSKQPDRSVVLTEPLKTEPKSLESWNQLFQKLRALLLQAYNRHLNKYEENMRTLREKRNEPGWTYFDYFAVQEELGFMLEVLGLREDALIQYDELDAMFDQFVENHAGGDPVTWLSPLLQPCTTWTGLSLAKPIDLDLRDRVKRTMISLLEFRNYLFCRQAALLFAMGRAWEVAERAFDFLRNTVNEMKALKVRIPSGGLQCWVVLSGLEVLAACQKHETGQVDKCSIYTAHLWDHVRGRLKELGGLCSLMPGMEPSSEQLNQVLDLKGGMALSHQQETVGDVPPVDKLHEALSSPGSFKKHYLEMCELAMGTYKHVSRFRSARKIGRELASFYMKIGEPQKAEGFLLDAVKMYRHEGWHSLAHATMRHLAACQKLMGHTKRFVVTACRVACSTDLPDQDRNQHFDEAIKALDSNDSVQMPGSSLIEIRQLELSKPVVKLDDTVSMTIHLHSRFPQPLTCDTVQLAMSPRVREKTEESDSSAHSEPITTKHSEPATTTHSEPATTDNKPVAPTHNSEPARTDSEPTTTTTAHSEPPPAATPAHSHQPQRVVLPWTSTSSPRVPRRSFPSDIIAVALYERRQGRLVASGVTSENATDLLKRTDSIPIAAEALDTVVKADYQGGLSSASSVVLSPGDNQLQLTMKASEEGWLGPSQVCIRARGLEMLLPLHHAALWLHVASYHPHFTLQPKHADEFVAGMEQAGTLTLHTGSQSIDTPSTATLQSSHPIAFTGGELHQTGGDLPVSAQEPHTSVSLDVNVHLPLEAVAASDVSFSLQVECCVDGWPAALQGEVKFVTPLSATHKIYTAKDKKYVQVRVQGNTSSPLTVTEPQLSGRGAAFTLLNTDSHWVVCRKQTLSLVWEVTVDNSSDDAQVTATFTTRFASSLDLAKLPRTFTYDCCLNNFQTWYTVEYTLSGETTITASNPGTQLSSRSIKCSGFQSGITYPFYLTVTPTGPRPHTHTPPSTLIYTLSADPTVWAFAGKTTGVFSLGEKPFRASLKVIPLAAGYQHLPRVQLCQHADTQEGTTEKSADIWVKRAEGEGDGSSTEADEGSPPSEPEIDYFLDPKSDLVEFSRGRVYNASLAKQVHIFPTPASSDMEVTMVAD